MSTVLPITRSNPAMDVITRRAGFIQSTLDGTLSRVAIDQKFASLLWEETHAGLFDRAQSATRRDTLNALMDLHAEALRRNGHSVAKRPQNRPGTAFQVPEEHYRY